MDEQNIFISYSRKDKDTVESIVSRIESELQKKDCCWIDVDGIKSGQMFWDIIIKAVKKCSAFLLMASDNSMSSNNVLGEIQIAKNNSKNIVPVIIDKDVLKNDRFLAHFPVNNYILADNPDHMSRLIHDLKNWCRLELSEHESVKVEVKSLSADVCLKVLSNLDCKVLIDCEEKAVALADRLTKISLPVGEYYAEFISTENPADAIAREIILEHDKLEKVDLLSLKQAREKSEHSERERLARIESMTLVPYISNNKVGFADLETREVIIPCKYDFISSFREGMASIKMNGKYGYIDKSGREVIPCRYDDAYSFSEGMASIKMNGKYGYIDKSGREVVPCRYDHAYPFTEGMAIVKMNGKYGYIDKSGREVVPCRYDDASYLYEGFAKVRINGKWGYIDRSGEVVPCRYDDASDFCEGMARVEMNGKYGYIDISGREVV
ncbi:MAG: WG repeat-containing protein, partial [Bacteroidales bacterium]|nr:WG repeat-containing protein [Bacteroidales bacterium]